MKLFHSARLQQGGYGWGTDFDFSFKEAAPGDTLFLDGNFNHSEAMLIPVTQEEIDAAFNGQLQHIVAETETYSSSNPFLYFPATATIPKSAFPSTPF